jgi:hypothetical protein
LNAINFACNSVNTYFLAKQPAKNQHSQGPCQYSTGRKSGTPKRPLAHHRRPAPLENINHRRSPTFVTDLRIGSPEVIRFRIPLSAPSPRMTAISFTESLRKLAAQRTYRYNLRDLCPPATPIPPHLPTMPLNSAPTPQPEAHVQCHRKMHRHRRLWAAESRLVWKAEPRCIFCHSRRPAA